MCIQVVLQFDTKVFHFSCNCLMLYNLAPVQTFILVKTHNQDIFLSLLNLMQSYKLNHMLSLFLYTLEIRMIVTIFYIGRVNRLQILTK